MRGRLSSCPTGGCTTILASTGRRAEQPTRRHAAWSYDGGETWEDWEIVDVLPDGRQDRSYGCMGGLVRLPVEDQDILLFSNLDTPNATRERVTVWASFDGGETWPVKRLVEDGPSRYSSLAAGRRRHGERRMGLPGIRKRQRRRPSGTIQSVLGPSGSTDGQRHPSRTT